LPYGILKVLESSSLSMSAEAVSLFGGSQKSPWAVEDGTFDTELSLKFSQYDDFLFEIFLGKAPTASTSESASGNVSTITDKYGGTIADASTGIASVSALSGSESDMKAGLYVVKAASSTTVDVYCLSDVDFARGTDLTYVNDALKITSSALTVTTGGDVNIPSVGLKITGGSGAIAFTTGHTATFSVRPYNTSNSTVRIGGSASQTMPEFGAVLTAQKRSSDELFELDCFRCKAAGLPVGFERSKFSQAEVKVAVFYDSAKDGIFDMTYIAI
jgi:hypothetical protein